MEVADGAYPREEAGNHREVRSAPGGYRVPERISRLTEHLKTHKKDFHSRRGLYLLVGQRRRLLRYLKREDPKRYAKLLSELGIRGV